MTTNYIGEQVTHISSGDGAGVGAGPSGTCEPACCWWRCGCACCCSCICWKSCAIPCGATPICCIICIIMACCCCSCKWSELLGTSLNGWQDVAAASARKCVPQGSLVAVAIGTVASCGLAEVPVLLRVVSATALPGLGPPGAPEASRAAAMRLATPHSVGHAMYLLRSWLLEKGTTNTRLVCAT